MEKQLILISHGTFCEELKKSTEMIMGPQACIHAVALLPEEGPEEFSAKFSTVTKEMDDFVVMADLMGGTPCNVASKLLLSGASFELYAGMNMPMVISFINSILTNQPLELLQAAKENITFVNEVLADIDDEDE